MFRNEHERSEPGMGSGPNQPGQTEPRPPSGVGVELGELLSSAIDAVVRSQEQLDRYTEQRQRDYQRAEPGSLAVPPLWYVFQHVALEMELSAHMDEVVDDHGARRPRILSQTLNPTMVGLYGREAAAGLRVRVQLGPQAVVPIKERAHDDSGQPTETRSHPALPAAKEIDRNA